MDEQQAKPIVFLSGDRLYLRPMELADLKDCQRWINDPETRGSLATYQPFNEIAERQFIEKTADTRNGVAFMIVLKESNRPIGCLGLMNIRWKDRTAEFGITVGEADCRGRGYGTEATELTLSYAFESLNLNRVQLGVWDFNTAGIRAYEKAGFVLEGTMRDYGFIAGRTVDHLMYSILAREYFARKDRDQSSKT
ncbi:MAG: GNAT family N-acetyltransferase [Phycisphaerae bacterium]